MGFVPRLPGTTQAQAQALDQARGWALMKQPHGHQRDPSVLETKGGGGGGLFCARSSA